jgi:hypothetical protein
MYYRCKEPDENDETVTVRTTFYACTGAVIGIIEHSCYWREAPYYMSLALKDDKDGCNRVVMDVALPMHRTI